MELTNSNKNFEPHNCAWGGPEIPGTLLDRFGGKKKRLPRSCMRQPPVLYLAEILLVRMDRMKLLLENLLHHSVFVEFLCAKEPVFDSFKYISGTVLAEQLSQLQPSRLRDLLFRSYLLL